MGTDGKFPPFRHWVNQRNIRKPPVCPLVSSPSFPWFPNLHTSKGCFLKVWQGHVWYDLFMERNPKQERQQAHALLDMLPDEKLNAVRTLLEVMVEPLSRSLALAAVEDDELTPETAAALERARASLARGESIPHEEILREFGVKK